MMICDLILIEGSDTTLQFLSNWVIISLMVRNVND